MSDGLFAMTPVALAEPERVPPDRARTERQRRAIAEGRHPLENVYPTWRHPETKGLAYERTDAKGRPHTCGSCRFREVLAYHGRTYPKCVALYDPAAGDPPRCTHGTASDVRAWWPACRDYEPGDSSLSPDAARCLPGGAP